MTADIGCLDHQLCEEMAEHVEKLTLSGQCTVDADVMKKFKKICRISDLYVKHSFYLLMSTLEKEHAEIRLAAFKIIDELFNRSHCFRDLLVSEFQVFLELTVEIDHEQPLPPPVSVAKKLRAETLKAIQQWYEKYGEAYKKLVLGYNFLKSCKLVDFNDIRTRTIAERQREEEIERKRRIVLNQKLDKVLQEITENVLEIETCQIEIENCLNLLVPRPDDFFISECDPVDENVNTMHTECEQTSDFTCESIQIQPSKATRENSDVLDSDGDNKLTRNISVISDDVDMESDDEQADFDENTSFVTDFGLGTRKYNLNIEIRPKSLVVEETEDNKDIFKTIRDAIRILKFKYIPKFTKWLEILTKAGDNDDTVKKMIDLRNNIQAILTKCIEMKVTEDSQMILESDDEDDDFEDVPEKEGYEAEVPLHLLTATEMGLKEDKKRSSRGRKPTNKEWSLNVNSTSLKDPTTRAANLDKLGVIDKRSNDQPSTSTANSKPANNHIRIIPFGPDIAYWENPEQIEKPMVIKYDSLHRFWTPSEFESETAATQHDVAELTSRTFHYPGKFIPVTWSCRAPLNNGSLCQRMDRVKCPFHGKIIGRDATGRPSNIEDARKLAIENAKADEDKKHDWRDPELQKDIEATLGIDLGSSSTKGKGKGKGKGNKKKYANLTDIKEIKNTSRNRLEKKIFNRNAMKRVTSAMDAADYKRVRDKFGNQFNYAHTK